MQFWGPGGQFVTYIGALHGNPYDGHTLKDTVAGVTAITGLEPERTFVDKGYRGHDYDQPSRVFRSGQKRGLTPRIKRSLRRRSAIEPVIGHMKEDGRLGRNLLSSRHGDRLNAGLSRSRSPNPFLTDDFLAKLRDEGEYAGHRFQARARVLLLAARKLPGHAAPPLTEDRKADIRKRLWMFTKANQRSCRWRCEVSDSP